MDQSVSTDIQARDIQANLQAKAAEVVPALKDEAARLADQSVHSGAAAATAVAKAAESAAQSLDEALPGLAGYVRHAADYASRFADNLHDKKAEELLAIAVTWSRQQPLLTLAAASALGFALSRVVKTGLAPVDSPTDGGSSNDR